MPHNPDYSETARRLQGHLAHIGKTYPGCWKTIDGSRAARDKELGKWPQWCFVPLAAAVAIVTDGMPTDVLRGVIDFIAQTIEDPKDKEEKYHRLFGDIASIGALASWRVSQGIYVFDPDLFESVVDTPFEKLPSEVFYRLPEWCMYVLIPESFRKRFGIYGFFVHLEFDVNTKATKLRFLLDSLAGILSPLILDLREPTITDAFHAIAKGQPLSPVESHKADFIISSLCRPLVSVTAYICSEDADVMGETPDARSVRPMPIKTRRCEVRIFPVDKTTEWRVGFRIGAALRRARTARLTEGTASDRLSPAPHIRRAHWHSFWTGKRTETSPGGRLIVRWLPPIPVGFEEDSPGMPVIHKAQT